MSHANRSPTSQETQYKLLLPRKREHLLVYLPRTALFVFHYLFSIYQLTEAWWRIWMWINWVITGWDTSLSCRQSLSWLMLTLCLLSNDQASVKWESRQNSFLKYLSQICWKCHVCPTIHMLNILNFKSLTPLIGWYCQGSHFPFHLWGNAISLIKKKLQVLNAVMQAFRCVVCYGNKGWNRSKSYDNSFKREYD